MRLTRDRIIAIGLAALDAVAERAVYGEPMQGPALRAALALLYTVGDGRRAAFDAFWAACGEDAGSRTRREAALHAAHHGIRRALGEGVAAPAGPYAPPGLDAACAHYHRLLNPPAPTRSGNDTRMQAPARAEGCGWL